MQTHPSTSSREKKLADSAPSISGQGKGRRRRLHSVRDQSIDPTLKELLDSLPPNFIQCRSYNKHNLKPIATFLWGKNRDCICRISECSSCKARKEDYYLPNMEKMDSRIEYPEGYLVTGYGRIPTSTIMKILMSHIEIKAPEELPASVTRRLSSKALAVLQSGETD